MHLSKLEIKGFKSFAHRSELSFDKGMTAVVGPNGCGKSNIADAIRWVLGEQSVRSLRGHKMEDIIFSGTDRKKAQGLAEVTIVFDNKSGELPMPYNEVAITRRVFRSGESEYLLNNSRCRLKDVKEMLMDTGIGKEGYSIIGQGRIDDLLSQKGEERRLLFDEAAGIVKFRTRKEEAEKKMLKTDENLNRLRDIILEIKGQIAPLREQAEKAEKYLSLRDKVAYLEVDVLIKDYDKYSDQVSLLSDEQMKRHQIVESMITEVKELDNEKQKIEIKTEEYIVEQEIVHNKIQSIKTYQEEHKTVHLLNCQKLEHLAEQKERLTSNLKEANRDKETKAETLNELHLKLSKQNEEIRMLSDKLSGIKESVLKKTEQLEQRQQQLEDKKAGIVETLNDIGSFKAKKERLKAMNESADQRNHQLINEIEKLEESLMQVSTQYDLEMEKSNKNESLLESLKQEIELLEVRANNIKGKKNDVEHDLYQTIKDYDQAVHRKNMLVNMEKSFEGFQRGVKNVLRAVQDNTNIASGFHGVVADLIRVPSGYETAVETALGASLQYLVTDDENQAKKIIEYLKQNQLGRVTILPLTIIKGRTLRNNELRILEEFPSASCALDIISFPSPYQKIFESLLGRVIISDDLNAAIKIAGKFNHQIKITTIEGDLLQPGGSMTGGTSTKTPEGLLVRKREIEVLGKNIYEMGEKKKKTESLKLDLENQWKLTSQHIMEKKDELSSHQELKVRLEGICNHLKNQKSEQIYRHQLLKDESSQLSDHQGHLNNEMKMLEKDLVSKEQMLKSVQKSMEFELSEQQIIKNEIDQQTKSLNAIQIEMAEKAEKEKAISAETEMVKQLYDNICERIQLVTDEIQDVRLRQQKVSESIEEDKQKEIEILLDLDRERQQLDEINETIRGSKHKLKEIVTNREVAAIRLEEVKEKIHQHEIKTSKIEWQVQQIADKLNEQHNFNLTQARIWLINNSMGDLKISELNRYKNEMNSLGDVHIGALEEYKRVRERFEFLLQQQKDLVQSKESLQKIVADLEEHMRTQFKEQFDKIQTTFNEVFKRLFHGGSTQLVLQKPDDLLSTGIDIIAQPPGKKSQHLSLLSGGEKALTAISLLFGILLVKPSPFCVLDEIEAALDDANVSRFADYLVSLSKGIQFIVVTHKKQTMERADTLYGITMEEKGVSKLVTLKLQEIDQNMVAG